MYTWESNMNNSKSKSDYFCKRYNCCYFLSILYILTKEFNYIVKDQDMYD